MKILTADEMREKVAEERLQKERSEFEKLVKHVLWSVERCGSLESGPSDGWKQTHDYRDSEGGLRHSFSPYPCRHESEFFRDDLLNKFRDLGYKVEINAVECVTKYAPRYIEVEDRFLWIFSTTKQEVVWDPVETKTFHTIKISL